MNVLRYTPNHGYTAMQDTMNSLVNALFNNEISESSEVELAPRMDMKENADKVALKLTMPGVDSKSIEISVTDDVLTIRAKAAEEEEENDEESSWIYRENRQVSYYRSVTLPALVVADQADARYKNGILYLTLPKAEEEKPKTISVKIAE